MKTGVVITKQKPVEGQSFVDLVYEMEWFVVSDIIEAIIVIAWICIFVFANKTVRIVIVDYREPFLCTVSKYRTNIRI